MFSISALQILDERQSATQIIILSPTRELAEQSARVVSTLGEYMNVKCHACIGGKSIGNDIRQLEAGKGQIVSGTPGRVFDLIQRQHIQTRSVKALILDEVILHRSLTTTLYLLSFNIDSFLTAVPFIDFFSYNVPSDTSTKLQL